jgi:hypothetical protein
VWLGKRKASDESFASLATQLPTKRNHIVASGTERIFPAGSLNQAIDLAKLQMAFAGK